MTDRTGLDDGPQLPTRPRDPSRPPAHTFTHTYAILEIPATAYRVVRLRLEDSAHGDPAVLAQMHRDYLQRDEADGVELLVFGPVALKAQREIVTRAHLLEERSAQLDLLMRDVRELVDELKGPQLPPMILENERVEAGGAGRKCGDCGHLFERGDKSFEGDRCETCAKVELGRRMDQHLKRARNKADLQAGGVEGFVSGRRP